MSAVNSKLPRNQTLKNPNRYIIDPNTRQGLTTYKYMRLQQVIYVTQLVKKGVM